MDHLSCGCASPIAAHLAVPSTWWTHALVGMSCAIQVQICVQGAWQQRPEIPCMSELHYT